ncbi:cAMP-binding protein [Desulfitobacterium dichloroeliminans LMG P-21439]|uniref:cAMP-binding protein n=1 Tax=Desulfitobacterium dichloroeliminans (strain LMG P-21439 / DCA1) TaxID=871963 RepID=L0F756_DESDL|nr:Crp/Fnr family transcriptional regulator [Desulfitobacterium dichloroeliminans]AGA68997.1 cAMP-binding protein [Desulfitobacterium dichloroeliminans LMG P-21439]
MSERECGHGCDHGGNHGGNHGCQCEGHTSCVSLVPIFNHLEDEQMAEITEAVHSASYKKGEIVYRAGDQSDSLYIVRTGRIRIYRLSESGKEQLVRFLGPGDFTGELALFSESIHESYAEAVENTEVCLITRTNLQQFLMNYPSISLKMLAEFSSRLEKSEKQTTRVSTEKVETRLALFLAECIHKEDSSMEFVLPMSKRDLASFLGTTPETISRKLTEFEDAGYIRQKPHRKIEVLDLDKLLLV